MGRCGGLFLCAGVFSGAINVLALAGSFYMLQVYDRILPSQSVPTLVALSVLLAGLLLAYGILDAVRLRLMARAGARIDRDVTGVVFSALPRLSLEGVARGRGGDAEPVRDLDQVRGFLSGLGPTALFDLPWMPIFLGVVFLLHPILGIFALAGLLILVAVTVATEMRSRGPALASAESESQRRALALGAQQNGEAITAMGLGPALSRRWQELNDRHLGDHTRASDVVGGMGALTRVLRLSIQSGMLGLGAYLVILGEVSAGTIIAASITMSRALAPIETAIAHWRGFMAARRSYARLSDLFELIARKDPAAGQDLPAPATSLSIENLTIGPPGCDRPTLANVSFQARAGDGIGIIGPSGSGKTTLARALVGSWLPPVGSDPIRLDGASRTQWPPDVLGRHVGYLPQDAGLLDGTVAEAIARCDAKPDLEAVILAARHAGCHEMILRLRDGYGTRIGPGGCALSAGQRQRIALARALFCQPFLVVLDEPNANLDAEGEHALTGAVRGIRQRGGIAIVIAHRRSALTGIDKVLALANGRMQDFGTKADVLARVLDSNGNGNGKANGSRLAAQRAQCKTMRGQTQVINGGTAPSNGRPASKATMA